MKKYLPAIAMLALVILAGCSDSTGAPAAVQSPIPPVTLTPAAGLAAAASAGGEESGIAQPVLASSELVVGRERFVLGLLDSKSGQPINDVPDVTIQFFKVHEDGTATKTGDAQPVFRNENLPAGVYVVRTDFDQAGPWGALVTISRQGQQPYQVKVDFQVLADSTVPMIGEPAPASDNLVKSDVENLGDICSAVPLDDMHDLTIAEAVKSGKPTVVLFAAPGFCPSFTCGPDLEMVQTIKQKYGDKANFVHIEAPNEIQNHTHEGPVSEEHRMEEGHHGVLKPQLETAQEWGLKSEPWLFLIDKDGKIADRFEGGLTLDEVEPEFAKLVQ